MKLSGTGLSAALWFVAVPFVSLNVHLVLADLWPKRRNAVSRSSSQLSYSCARSQLNGSYSYHCALKHTSYFRYNQSTHLSVFQKVEQPGQISPQGVR